MESESGKVRWQRLACITMDLEPDFTGNPAQQNRHYGLFDTAGEFERFICLLNKWGVKLTVFIVGQVLDDRPDYVRELERYGVEFASHSRTHNFYASDPTAYDDDIRKGLDHFADFFGYSPLGYRSPRGRIEQRVLKILEDANVSYDSSVLPSFRPGVYSHLDKPLRPFRWKGANLIEIPLGVLPRIRYPTALSYQKVIGKNFFALFQRLFGVPDPMVYLFHPMDLVYSSDSFSQLSVLWKTAYSINRQHSWAIIDWYLEKLVEIEYRFTAMSELYALASQMPLREIEMPKRM